MKGPKVEELMPPQKFYRSPFKGEIKECVLPFPGQIALFCFDWRYRLEYKIFVSRNRYFSSIHSDFLSK
jgi:hypothetical protein